MFVGKPSHVLFEPPLPHPHIVVGITDAQTCLVLSGRLRALREAGFRVTLVSNPGDLLELTSKSEGVESISCPMKRGIAPFADFISLIRLGYLLWRLHPDLTEFSTPKAGLLGNLVSKIARVPMRVYMLRGLKLETCTGIKRRILWAAERLSCACAHVVLCNSASLKNEARSMGIAPADKLCMLGSGSSNGVDVERFSPGPGSKELRSHHRLPEDALVLGFVGRLTRDKGIPELIEAFDVILAAQPKTYLLLVGWFDASEDALDDAMRIRILTHPHIRLTGYVADTAPYYRIMDLMVLPSWREGFPNVLLEAGATGIPVVATLCTGSRDAMVPEVTGLLIPPGYPEAICEAVLCLLRNPERRQSMGRAARAWVLEHYVDRDVLRMTTEFYKNLFKQLRPSQQMTELEERSESA